MSREKSAGAVIFNKEDGKIYYLLLHYGKASPAGGGGHWDFSKGHPEEGEEEEETVKREVEEETGIKDIKIIDGFKEYIKYFFRKSYDLKKETRLRQGFGGQEKKASPARNASRSDAGEWVFKTVTFYLAETKTKEVKISFEHVAYKWLPYKEALKQLTYKKAKEILKKAHHFLMEYEE